MVIVCKISLENLLMVAGLVPRINKFMLVGTCTFIFAKNQEKMQYWLRVPPKGFSIKLTENWS